MEGLYQSLSEHAGNNGLVISKIEKKKRKPVYKRASTKSKKKKKKKKGEVEVKTIAYYEIPVGYEIKGNFLGYIKFKRALSRSEKMLNFFRGLDHEGFTFLFSSSSHIAPRGAPGLRRTSWASIFSHGCVASRHSCWC